MKSERNSTLYVAWFIVSVVFFLATAVPLSIYFGPISGDLTRIGNWSERDFAGKRPQSEIKVQTNGGMDSNPQVLVLGDSFSYPNIWQSYLAESSKLEILSFKYQDVGCVNNWLDWIAAKNYPNLKAIVIQIAERSFVSVFRNLHTCDRRIPEPIKHTAKSQKQAHSVEGVTLDVTYLFPAAVNMLCMAWNDGRIVSGEVINVPLSRDNLFSNHKSKRLLYYADDDRKKYWSEKEIAAAVGNLKTIQDGLTKGGLRFAVVVVPDKSNAYRKYLVDEIDREGYPDIFEKLMAAGVNSIDLLFFFQQAVSETVDLYLPNDTHLSTQGYKLMSAKIFEYLQR